jgi:sigma-B regulation protein RsbU (phosphoserine phosphatase)
MLAVDSAPRTLIADDQPDVLEALRLLLKGAGFQTEVVTSPAAALEALKSGNYDLLLMDLNYARDTTSGFEGLDLLSRVRALDRELPVVVMTAWGSVEIAIEALRGGVTDFILKPWENNQLVETLRKHVASGRAIRSSHRLTAQQQQEMADARAIQERLIPLTIPDIPGYQISAAWRPARIVSGDYYDVLRFNDQKLGLCIGDVSGKGTAAALLMSNVQAAVRAFATESAQPDDLCARLNKALSSNTGSDKFVSFFYGLLDGTSGKLQYANAGHNPPAVVRRDGSVDRLDCGGIVLGPIEDAEYQLCETELGRDDIVLLFTDGVTEACDDQRDEFGEELLIELAIKNRHLSAQSLNNLILEELMSFTSETFNDDVTMIVLKVIDSAGA